MKRRNVLWTILTIFVVTAVLSQTPTTAEAATPTIAVSPLRRDIRDKVDVGGTFRINITVTSAEKLWGYQFGINYNTTILTAVANGTYAPFNDTHYPSETNDIAGYVALAWSSYFGDPTGVTSVEPYAIAWTEFRVDALGTTDLKFDREYTELSDVEGGRFGKIVEAGKPVYFNLEFADGKFSNTEELGIHDIAVTALTVSKTEAAPGDSISLEATIKNNGDFNETFTVTAYYNETEIDTESDVSLNAGKTKTVLFTWDTTGVKDGVYAISVKAILATEENPGDNTFTYSSIVTIKGTTTGFNIMYIAAAVVVAIVAGVGIYGLRARGKKRS